MKKREIVLDDESDRKLELLATEYDGDVTSAIRDLLSIRETLEAEIDTIEDGNADDLLRQKERSEREFAEGKVVPWSELRRRCGL